MNQAEQKVSQFYNTVGWRVEADVTEDARRWEDLRKNAQEYISKCRLRVLRHLPDRGTRILDMASGPIQYKEYLEYSKNFDKRYCVDLSGDALEQAAKKIGDHGVFLHGSFFDLHLENDFFDAVVSLHTLYHIDKDKQEEAVRKLISVTKPGKPVIIVYANPRTILSFIRRFSPQRILRRAARFLKKPEHLDSQPTEPTLYYYAYPIPWWSRFSDLANLKVLPWRSFDADDQKRLIPDNAIGKKMLDVLFHLEDRFPVFFGKHFQYPMIILTKKTRESSPNP